MKNGGKREDVEKGDCLASESEGGECAEQKKRDEGRRERLISSMATKLYYSMCLML